MKILYSFWVLLLLIPIGFAQTNGVPKLPTITSKRTNFPHEAVRQFYSEQTFVLREYLLSLNDFLMKYEFESESEYRSRLNYFFSKATVPSGGYLRSERTSLSNLWLPVIVPFKYDAEIKAFRYDGSERIKADSMIYPPSKEEELVVFVESIPVSDYAIISSKIRLSICLPMETESARKNSENIRVSFNGTPIRYNSASSEFIFVPKSFVIFNRETGEVFAKDDISVVSKKNECIPKVAPTILGFQ